MPHISAKELAILKEVARTATMGNASFSFPNEIVLASRESFGEFAALCSKRTKGAA